MAQIVVPEKFAAELKALAQQDDRPIEAVVDEAISSYIIERSVNMPLTPGQVEHIRRGLESAERGELVSQEEVEAFFDDWEREAASR